MLLPLEQVRDHQNPLADPTALASRQAPQLCRPGSLRKKYAGIAYPTNMVRLPSYSTTSGDHWKPVLLTKQREANRLLGGEQRHSLLVGSASSGKTFTIVRRIMARGLRAPGS